MSDTQHTVVGVLPTQAAMQTVIDKLELDGFDHAQFGVLARKADLSQTAAQVAADPAVATEAPLDSDSGDALAGALVGGLLYVGAAAAAGAILLTGGGLGLALIAALGAGGAGGLVGALAAHGLSDEHAQMIQDQVTQGGLVLWIQPRDAAQEGAAKAQLAAAGATRVVVQGAD